MVYFGCPVVKLPSINLLVSFEAAARLLSFKLAAQELYVTPSAVSHQIRTLEKELGLKLFVRLNRDIALTQQGQVYFDKIHPAIVTIKQANADVKAQQVKTKLTLHSIPYLTEAFLAPHIQALKSKLPNIELAIESSIQRADLFGSMPNEINLAIRFADKQSTKLIQHEIAQVSVTPICHESYLSEANKTQLSLTPDPYSWAKWQDEWQNRFNFNDTIHCDSFSAVLNMAEQGLGVAMGYYPFIKNKVQLSRLTEIYPDKFTNLGTLNLVHSDSFLTNDPTIQIVKTWLTEAFNINS